MAAQRVVSSGTEYLLHPRTGRAKPGSLDFCVSDAKAPVLQREQVNSAHRDIAPEQSRTDLIYPEKRSDGSQMLPLDQGHLSRVLRVRLPQRTVVADQANSGDEFHFFHTFKRRSPGWTNSDPLNATDPG